MGSGEGRTWAFYSSTGDDDEWGRERQRVLFFHTKFTQLLFPRSTCLSCARFYRAMSVIFVGGKCGEICAGE
jgi:hypothetical protein